MCAGIAVVGPKAGRMLGLFQQFQVLERQAAQSQSQSQSQSPLNEDEPQGREFMWKTLKAYPGYISGERVWELFRKEQKISASSGEEKAEFLKTFRNVRAKFGKMKEKEKTSFRKKREVRRQHKSLMGGYTEKLETETVDNVTENDRVSAESLLINALRDDVDKAKYYVGLTQDLRETLPVAADHLSDALVDVVRAAMRTHVKDALRPVLTHELADFENPYMMMKSARERLLHKVAVRSKFEESLVEAVVEEDPEMARLRSQVEQVPPEVLEPLMAFRGVTDWSNDAATRLQQKLTGVNRLLDAVVGTAKKDGSVAGEWRWKHPFKNHLGFVSQVPKDERLGGWNFGRPESAEMAELKKMRYPTLQRVAHSLSTDPVYQSATAHSIDVLERSKGWSFQEKIKAVNTMKEVFDNLPTSAHYKRKLDQTMPLIRRRARHGFVSVAGQRVKLFKTFPRNWRTRSRLGIYHKSFVASKSLSARQAERRQKDVDRKKKEDREKKQAQLAKKKK